MTRIPVFPRTVYRAQLKGSVHFFVAEGHSPQEVLSSILDSIEDGAECQFPTYLFTLLPDGDVIAVANEEVEP